MAETIRLTRYRDGVLAPVEGAALRDVLRRLTIEPNADGWAEMYAGDGGEASLDLCAALTDEGLDEATVHVTLFTRGLTELVYDIARATGMVVTVVGGHRVLLIDGDQASDLPPDLVEAAHTCVDGAELHWWIAREAPRPGLETAPAPPPRNEAVTRSDALRSLFGLFRRE